MTASGHTTQRRAATRSTNVEAAIERLRAVSESSGQGAFVARALYALATIAATADEELLTAAAGAPSDYDVLLQVLEAAELQTLLDDPLARAKLRGLRYRQQLLEAEGGVLTAGDVAEILHISRQAVDKRRRKGQLLALAVGRRAYAFPAWQFDARLGLLPGIDEVFRALAEHDPWMQLSFMLNPNAALSERTPLEALRAGERETVLRAARFYGAHGAV